MSNKPSGLQQRYTITKTNGNPMDPTADYFVLRLDRNGEPRHVQASLAALAVYANEIQYAIPDLAADLITKYDLNRVPFNLITLSPRLTA